MAFEVGSVDIGVRANLGQLPGDFARAEAQANQFDQSVSRSMQNVQRAQDSLHRSAGQLPVMYSRLRAAFASVLGVLSVRSIANMADTWSDLTARLRFATGSTENATAVLERLNQIARRTYSSLQLTAEGFLVNSQSLKALGFSTQKQLDFTEAMNNALVVSGAKGQRAASVQFALNKAMGLGRLQGQELNTVMSAGGRVIELLAEELGVGSKEMGVNTGALRRLAAEGKITGRVISDALLSNLEKLREEADSMPATIADAFILIGNSMLMFTGTVDQAGKLTEGFAKKLVGVADAIAGAAQPTINLVSAAVGGMQSAFAAAGVSAGMLAKVGTTLFVGVLGASALVAVRALGLAINRYLVSAFVSLALAIRANPLALFITVVASAIAIAIQFRKEIAQSIGVDVLGTLKKFANFSIGVFRSMFADWKFVWDNLEPLAQAAMVGVRNAIARGVNDFTAMIIDGFNALSVKVNEFLQSLEDSRVGQALSFNVVQVPEIKSVAPLKEIENTAAAGMEDAFADRAARIAKNMSTDYVGALHDIAAATGAASDATGDLDDAVSGMADAMDPKAAKALTSIIENAQMFIEQQHMLRDAVGQSAETALRMRYEFELLASAAAADIQLGPTQIQRFKDLAAEMANAEAATNRLQEAFEFSSDVFKGFFQDLMGGLREGQSFFESFGNAVQSVLDKLTDKLLDMATDQLINSLWGNIGGLLGGGAGGGGLPFGGSAGAAGLTGAGLFHAGGIAGQSAVTKRYVRPEIFTNAPRYHGGGVAGLKSNEVPAILRKGEPVFSSMEQARSSVGGGGVNIKFELKNESGTPLEHRRTGQRQENGELVIEAVLTRFISEGRGDRAFGNRYGMSPQSRGRG